MKANDDYESDSSSFAEEDDQDWADWVDDDEGTGFTYTEAGSKAAGFKIPTRALFAEENGEFETYDNPLKALEVAKSQGGDLVKVVKRLSE